MLGPNNATKHESISKRKMLVNLWTKPRFLLPFCSKMFKVHFLHYSICSLKNTTHITGMLFCPFYARWASGPRYARVLVQDYSPSKAELVPKPVQHSFFSYPAFLIVKITMLYVATEFKAGRPLLTLGMWILTVSLDGWPVWAPEGKEPRWNHRHYLDGVWEAALPELDSLM